VNDLVEIEDKKKEKENRITADKKLCEFMQSLMVKKFGKNIEARLIVRDVNATVWEVHKVNRRSTLLRLMFAPFPLRTKRKKLLQVYDDSINYLTEKKPLKILIVNRNLLPEAKEVAQHLRDRYSKPTKIIIDDHFYVPRP
jgi:hypothetical protein